jgi:hypothetical protein
MKLLTSAEARQMAESMWGRGGTTAQRTNTRGAFYFSCSGHGGFVIDTRALNAAELADVKEFALPVKVTRFYTASGKTIGMMTPYRQKSIRLPFDYRAEIFDVLVLEEDCEWALAYRFTTVRFTDDAKRGPEREAEMAAAAAKTFWDWYDQSNPAVRARKAEDKARADGHPGLITSASQEDDAHTLVWTADGARHRVTGYEKARDDFGTPWLYLCETVEHLEGETV